MNRSELVSAVALSTGFGKGKTEILVSAALETIAERLADGESVRLAGLGTLEVRMFDARKGRNPKTGELLEIPARRAVAFRPATAIREALRSLPEEEVA